MSGIHSIDTIEVASQGSVTSEQGGYLTVKRGVDVLVCLLLLPVLTFVAGVLWIVNPIYNPGPVFFVQKRMGQGCKAIRVIKLRTMRPAPRVKRGADDPLETARIPPLGRFLRQTRLDELPQILNVLRGQMSLIGPRPDYFPHALDYLRIVHGYRARHTVLPGISGLAQVELGYAQGIDATQAKVAADLVYVRARSVSLDARIFVRTLIVVLCGRGK